MKRPFPEGRERHKESISVFVVENSSLMRRFLEKMIAADPALILAGTAINGDVALEELAQADPEIILLDLQMPEKDGIAFLEERKKRSISIPVIIFAAVAKNTAAIVMRAMALGASDFVPKATGGSPAEIEETVEILTALLKRYGGEFRKERTKAILAQTPQKEVSGREHKSIERGRHAPKIPGKIEVVAMGISTGGPKMVRYLLAHLEKGPFPILIVQHMPSGFTKEFALSLDKISPWEVKEAIHGEKLRGGTVIIAPGDAHLSVRKEHSGVHVRLLKEAEPVSGHKPSIDVLFSSVAKTYKNHTLAILMTGMGHDGADKMGEIYREGGQTWVQDKATSVIHSMPRAAIERGCAQEVLSLEEITRRLGHLVQRGSPS